MYVPQGRMLGGGSSLNAMVYIRGTAADYDGWRDAGLPRLGLERGAAGFKRAEGNVRFSGPIARHRRAAARQRRDASATR